MSDIKKSLTKKLGPFPVWVWALVTIGAYVLWRRRQAAAASQSGQVQSYQTNSPPDLSYVPGGALPEAPADGGGGSSDDTSGLLSLLGSLLSSGSGSDGSGGGSGSGSSGNKRKPKNKKGLKLPKLKGKGAIRAPSGHNKPTAPKGYKAVGLGHGNWEFVPIGNHKRSRSSATIKSPTSRERSTSAGKVTQRSRNPKNVQFNKYTSASTTRQRPTNPVVVAHPTVTQRPAASHTRTQRETVKPAPRPSSPPKRTMRAVRKGR